MIHGLNGSLYDIMITSYDVSRGKNTKQKLNKILGKSHCLKVH